ncbi:MAG: protein phosphatase 2C domain-containing protein [Acidobacteriia bacterium]|nr:protein phosphatase 2C domain-containing protein [Terriglobia bacterium]
MEKLIPGVLHDSRVVWAHPERGGIQFFRGVVHLKKGLTLEVQLGYRRYIDFDKTNASGQDAAGVRFDDSFLVGVIADGVSQSFFGDLAATHVSKWLLDKLWENREYAPEIRDLEKGLGEQEKVLAAVVEAYSINDVEMPMLRTALESMRKLGSQSVFSAFIWDLSKQTGSFYQVGNVAARIYCRDKSPELFQGTNGRWSSAQKSKLQLSQIPLGDCVGLVLSSDGVENSWAARDPKELTQTAFTEVAEPMAAVDDVSFVSAFIRKTGVGAKAVQPGRTLEKPPVHRTPDPRRVSPDSSTNLGTDSTHGQKTEAVKSPITPDEHFSRALAQRLSKSRNASSVGRLPLWNYLNGFVQGALFALLLASVTIGYFWIENRVSFGREADRLRPSVASSDDSGTKKSVVVPAHNDPAGSSGPAGVGVKTAPQDAEASPDGDPSNSKVTASPGKDKTSPIRARVVKEWTTEDFLARYRSSMAPRLQGFLKSPDHGIVLRISLSTSLATKVDLRDGSQLLFKHPVSSGETVFFDGNPAFATKKDKIVHLRLYRKTGGPVVDLPTTLKPGISCYELEILQGEIE